VLEVTESERRMEGVEAREEVPDAQKSFTESGNSGNLGRAEEMDRRSAPGQMRSGIKHQGDSMFTPLDTIEA
jgi:hypothetical protein